MSIRFRAVSDDFEPLESHTHIDGDEYVTESDEKLDLLEEAGKIEVLDWEGGSDDGRVSFDGPAEPIIRQGDEDGEDGSVEFVKPSNQSPGINRIELGTWKCERCNTRQTTPVVGGELEEPHECPESDGGCGRQGPFTHVGGIDEDDLRTAEQAGDAWDPPSGISDNRFEELWCDVRTFIRDHWDAKEDELYEGLTAFAITTWLREELTFVPHLMLMGKTTGGKTRLLNTLSRVSYRSIVSASATPSSMFRLIDGYDVTFYVSEYHGLDHDTQLELDNIVRAGQKRGEKVTRSEQASAGYIPRTFDPFSHIAVATQYTPEDDIVNRCIQVRSSTADRDMPATVDDDRARNLRNRLLYARYRLLESDEWENAEEDAYVYLEKRNIDGRTREKLLSIVSVAHIWDRVEAIDPFVDEVVQQDREAAGDSEDALVVEAIRDLAFEEISETSFLGDVDPFAKIDIPLADIADRYEDMTGTEKSSAWVGHVRDRLDLEKERRRDGTVISDPDLRPKLRKLCEDLHLDWETLDTHSDVVELPEDEQGPAASGCEECGRDTYLTHRYVGGHGGRICAECADDIE